MPTIYSPTFAKMEKQPRKTAIVASSTVALLYWFVVSIIFLWPIEPSVCFSTTGRGSGGVSRSSGSKATTLLPSSSSPSEHKNINNRKSLDFLVEWGLQYGTIESDVDHHNKNRHCYHRGPKYCPTIASHVVDDCFDVIAGTLTGNAQPDPNIRFASSPSLWATRPLRSSPTEGRIGIEIDSAHLLFPDIDHEISEGRALRRLALLLATKLAMNKSWNRFDLDADRRESSGSSKNKDASNLVIDSEVRSVVLVFNTRKEALLASHEIKILLQRNSVLDDDERQALVRAVKVQCMDDEFPEILKVNWTNNDGVRTSSNQKGGAKTKQRPYSSLPYNPVNPSKGLMMIVQPTDFANQLIPPSPTPYTLRNLQRYIACALLQETPVVVMSPRFVFENIVVDGGGGGGYMYDGADLDDASTSRTYHSRNSMAYQRADYFGGYEPARGQPWVLRDFFPPSYVWVGNALGVKPRRRQRYNQEQIKRIPHEFDGDEENEDIQLTLTHSVMDQNHPWHIYASSTSSFERGGGRTRSIHLARTQCSSGRPTKEVLRTVMSKFQQSLAHYVQEQKNEE